MKKYIAYISLLVSFSVLSCDSKIQSVSSNELTALSRNRSEAYQLFRGIKNRLPRALTTSDLKDIACGEGDSTNVRHIEAWEIMKTLQEERQKQELEITYNWRDVIRDARKIEASRKRATDPSCFTSLSDEDLILLAQQETMSRVDQMFRAWKLLQQSKETIRKTQEQIARLLGT